MSKKRRRPGQLRVGDRVEVAEPVFVARVGYPKTVNDYLPFVDERLPDSGLSVVEAVTGQRFSWRRDAKVDKVLKRLRHDLAWLLAHRDGFGGRERSLHLVERVGWTKATALVVSLRTVVTGTYEPASGGWNTWDVEPPSLARAKAHRLATLSLISFATDDTFSKADEFLREPEIEVRRLHLLESSS